MDLNQEERKESFENLFNERLSESVLGKSAETLDLRKFNFNVLISAAVNGIAYLNKKIQKCSYLWQYL